MLTSPLNFLVFLNLWTYRKVHVSDLVFDGVKVSLPFLSRFNNNNLLHFSPLLYPLRTPIIPTSRHYAQSLFPEPLVIKTGRANEFDKKSDLK